MSNQSRAEIAFIRQRKYKISNSPDNTLCGEETIEIRELDHKYTHANLKEARCTMADCNNRATHWLTRTKANYCQSDMVCDHHAAIWMKVKYLIS